MTSQRQGNIYLSGPIFPLFVKTAFPIVLVMVVNGLFTVVDAYFLGTYVGGDAVIAVTLMFPLYMFLIALTTLVSAGFSSIYARALGAFDTQLAQAAYAGAIQISVLTSLVLITGFLMFGVAASLWIANGAAVLAELGRSYMAILIWCAPLAFVLSINIDALRSEGLLRALAAITLLSAMLNIGFDWMFVGWMGWGVQGSAYGTVLAQSCAMAVFLIYRWQGPARPRARLFEPATYLWRDLLALGAPLSLGYIGMSLSAAATLYCLQLWAGDRFEPISGAFGIMTRLMTFTFLPLLGVSLAFQTIVGNNFGAGLRLRTRQVFKVAVLVALIYCLTMQIALVLSAPYIGAVFVDDLNISAELARILPIATLTLFVFGPMMMIASYFQAIGDVRRAALLGLSRTYLFALPLTFVLPYVMGETGIWYSGVIAECLVLLVTCFVLMRRPESLTIA